VVHGPSFSIHDYILTATSLLAIAAYVIHQLVKTKKLNLPEIMMTCLLLSLFMAIVCFILIKVPAGRDRIGCQALAAIVQYFFLSSSMWSNAMAYDITKTLRAMSVSSQSVSRLKFYVPYAMGCPLVCVLVAVTLSQFEITAFNHPVYRERSMFPRG